MLPSRLFRLSSFVSPLVLHSLPPIRPPLRLSLPLVVRLRGRCCFSSALSCQGVLTRAPAACNTPARRASGRESDTTATRSGSKAGGGAALDSAGLGGARAAVYLSRASDYINVYRYLVLPASPGGPGRPWTLLLRVRNFLVPPQSASRTRRAARRERHVSRLRT